MAKPISGASTGWLAAFRDATTPNGLHLLEASPEESPPLIESRGRRILFDGVLYNRADLLERFGDDTTREPGDADLVGHAYHRWGEDAISRLQGIFALIVSDPARDLLLCARDPLGIRPLFYAELDGTFLLSPAIEAILGRAEVSSELNRACLVDRLSRHWPATEETYFTRVRRVPPGHTMRIAGRDRQTRRYWNPVPADRSIPWIPDDEAQERFEASLTQAVARCLTPGTAGIYMSGGLDSSMLAMVAEDLSRQQGAPPWALSLVFSDSGQDERVQRAVAMGLGLPQFQLPFEDAAGPDGTLASALSLSRTLPAPLTVIWRPALERLAVHAREHDCRVILAGDGADEWLWENPVAAADLLGSLDAAGLYRLWRVYARSYQFSRREAFRLVVWRYGARRLLSDAYHGVSGRLGARDGARRAAALRAARSPTWVAPDPALHVQLVERLEASYAREETGTPPDSYYLRDTRSRLDAPDKWFREEETFLVGQRLGVPIREPFWDPDLISLLVRVRPGARSADGLAKTLVRRPLARRFPGLGFDGQRKSDLGVAFLSVLATQAASIRRAMGGFSALVDLGVIDRDQVTVLLDDALAGRSHRDRLGWVWELLNLEAWARAHR